MKTSKYETVAQELGQIASKLEPHDALPSERELMGRYGVSRMTVRAAIAKLIDDGLVYKVPGSGTYVGSTEMFSKGPGMSSFTEDMTARGMVPSSRILSMSRVAASTEIAQWLGLTPGDECTYLGRLRLADGIPMAIENCYVPATVLPLDRLLFDQDVSLYEQLARVGQQPYRSEQEILAVNLAPDEAQLLEVEPYTAALCVERTSTTNKGYPVEYVKAFYRADRYSFHVAMTRESL